MQKRAETEGEGSHREQRSERRAETTCEQRLGAAGSGAAGFSGALNDPCYLSCIKHTVLQYTLSLEPYFVQSALPLNSFKLAVGFFHFVPLKGQRQVKEFFFSVSSGNNLIHPAEKCVFN